MEYKGTLLSETEAKVRPDLTYWHIVLRELNSTLKKKQFVVANSAGSHLIKSLKVLQSDGQDGTYMFYSEIQWRSRHQKFW